MTFCRIFITNRIPGIFVQLPREYYELVITTCSSWDEDFCSVDIMKNGEKIASFTLARPIDSMDEDGADIWFSYIGLSDSLKEDSFSDLDSIDPYIAIFFPSNE